MIVISNPLDCKREKEIFRERKSHMVGSSNGFFQWNSSAPYLFGGLGIVFGIIGMALLVLSCYRRNPTSPENSLCDDAEEKSVEKRSSQGGDELKLWWLWQEMTSLRMSQSRFLYHCRCI
ncbi:Protein GLUTAMINE DUMPER [Quillaja saponaria]|uniref:Protein GLUTAMINE DUMPER n=1 Tax=Quillaja saponaria TaxID=32244 RepID=A0AAD7PIL4_QUISA|nr:Protein GLUTAMINE DUMPER [Quillaja saponaria]